MANILDSIFNWFKREDQTGNPTKVEKRSPIYIDWTDSEQINYALTSGLYHNNYPGMKLAGGLAFPPIAVPVWFMGLPFVSTEDENEETQEILDKITLDFSRLIQQIHIQCHRDGTLWIWPHFSMKNMKIIWETIRDDTVSDIIRDLDTGDIIKIITDEQIKISTDYNTTIQVRRKRIFTKTKIEIQYLTGSSLLPESIKDKTMRNPLRILPIPFANNTDADETRGHSDYERIISDLKNYHDIDLAWSRMLSKFSVKMVQETSDVKQWKANNGYASLNEIEIDKIDLIFNLKEQETTEFIFPENAHQAYDQKLKNIFRKIVEASGIPEIVWGLKTEGNRASVEESMGTLIKYVHDKQEQKNDSYKMLYAATLKLSNIVNMRNVEDIPLIVSWDDLDAVSDEVRSIIFRNFAQGLAAIFEHASATKQQTFNLWKQMYPRATEEDFDEYVKGISDMGGHRQWTTASYSEALDFQSGNKPEEENPEDEPPDDTDE